MKTSKGANLSQRILVILSTLMIFLMSCIFTSGVKPASTPTTSSPTETLAAAATDTLPPEPTAKDTRTTVPTQLSPTQPSKATATAPNIPTAKATQPAATKTPVSGGSSTGKLASNPPWLIFRVSNGLWIANPDGSALTQLSKEAILGPSDLTHGLSPDGKMLAFISGDPDSMHNLILSLMTLPDGKVKLVTTLTSKATEPGPWSGTLDAKTDAVRSITEVDSMAWSPDGKSLAFIGLQAGPTADLYSYTLSTGKIAHLSDGPAQAYGPQWSPDGNYIVNFGVTTFGTGGGYTMAGGWATTPDGSQTITLFPPGGSAQEFGGWVNGHTFLINSWTMMCGPQDLRIYDLSTKKETSLVKGCFNGKAVAEYDGTILVAGNGNSGGLKGLYIFGPSNFTRKQLSQETAQSVQYLKQDGGFLVKFDHTQTIYTGSGEAIIQAPAINCGYNTSLAAFGALYAWTCSKGEVGVWVNGPGVPANKVFDQAAILPAWSGKNTLFFFNNGTFYRGLFPDYKPEAMGKIDGDTLGLAWAGQP